MPDLTMPARMSAHTQDLPLTGPLPGTALWGARAAVAAPLVAVFSIATGIPVYADEMRDAAGSGRWVVTTATALALLILLAFALLALHRLQEDRLGRLGHAGFAIAAVGTILAAGGAWDSTFTVPYLAENAPAVLDRSTDGSLLAGYVSSYLVFAIGWATFAVATVRAGMLSRGPAIALVVGSLLAILPAPTAIRVLVLTVAAALLGRSALRAHSAAMSHQ